MEDDGERAYFLDPSGLESQETGHILWGSRMGESKVKAFFQDRGLSLAMVVVIMCVLSLSQANISYTIGFGELRGYLRAGSPLLTAPVTLRLGALALLVVPWTLNSKRVLFHVIIVVNASFTLALLGHTIGLITILFGLSSRAIDTLLLDVVLMAVSNIQIFSI